MKIVPAMGNNLIFIADEQQHPAAENCLPHNHFDRPSAVFNINDGMLMKLCTI